MQFSLFTIFFVPFILVAAFTPLLIQALRTLKLTQPIRSELPADHQAKLGTPLMAGLILIIGVVISLVFQPSDLVWFLCITFVLFAAVGFIDDFKKAAYQDPSGIASKTKLILQFTITGILLFLLFNYFSLTPTISLYRDVTLELPIFLYLFIMIFFIVGSANAINFTDGLDGLLINVSIPTYLFFFIISDSVEVKTFCIIMVACLLGLLIYNAFPARAFMGDTGSLAIGGSLSFLAIIEKVEILIPLLFFVYLFEQLSVIIQVWYYKKTKLRIFKMAPVHFHFSLKYGWSENKIVVIFGLVSWSCALLSWIFWSLFLK